MRERPFFAGFAAGAAVLLASAAVLNHVVDPYGLYGSGRLPPYSWNLRQAKVDHLLGAPAAPQVLLLGSSRAFALRPERIHEGCGLSAYNASVSSGRLIDYIGLLRAAFARADADRLRTVIVQLDLESFWDDIDIPFELRATPALLRFAAGDPSLMSSAADRLARSVSLSQVADSVRSIRQHYARRPPNLRVDDDGVVHFASREIAMEDGRYDLRAAIAEEIPYEQELFRQRHGMSELQVERFRTIVNEAAAHRTRLIVWLSPVHPALLDALRPLGWERQHRAVVAQMDALRDSGLEFAFHDLTTIDRFDGRASEFLNATHVTTPAADRIVDMLLTDVCV